jgi:hypothetical protein
MADGVTTAHGRRFGLAYLGLAAVLGAAVGTFVLLAERGAPPPPPPWSAWTPTEASPILRSTQIAVHVASRYRLPSGKRLVRVYVGNPTGNAPIRFLAVAKKSNPQNAGDFNTFDGSSTLMYILCGAGKQCAINEGTPTTARAAVLRREALELALYTFTYVDGVDSVVTFFPPRPGQKPQNALFFRKDDLDDQLDSPLASTLPDPRPPVPGKAKLSKIEQQTVDELTTERVFRYAVENARDGARVLVLAPVA